MESRITPSWFILFIFLLFFFFSNTHFSSAADTLPEGQSLYGDQTLVSKQGNFELGFFKPSTSPNYYVAIWYKKISYQTVVWVANRDSHPLTDPSTSELKLLENGNLVILNQSKIPIWSTNTTSNASELVLGDDANLVLRERLNPSNIFWQSFDHLSDTWLPGGKLRYDNKTKSATLVTCWKNLENPAQGMFSLKLDPDVKGYGIVWNRSTKYWTSGAWDGQRFSSAPEKGLDSLFNMSFISNENESYFYYTAYDKSTFTRILIGLSGQVKQLTWMDDTKSWNLLWVQPTGQCKVYAFCGVFSTCNQNGEAFCQCLPGFEPHSWRDWNLLNDSSGGCVRKTSLQCDDKDGFWLVSNVKLPETTMSFAVRSDQECKLACLKNCSCNAYSIDGGGECLIWDEDLLNIQQLQDGESGGRDIYLRLETSEIQRLSDKKESDQKTNVKVIIIIAVLVGLLAVGILICISWRWMTKQRAKKNMEISSLPRRKDISESLYVYPRTFGDLEQPIFIFENLEVATNNFDSANKLGEGGFGPVYKGKLSDGQEIAVKRLSKSSGQGLEEFINEVVVSSKLQHRNLVRLLGCCIQGEERMLIYEYMPNKSLDAFIFDSTKQALLDWRKRFEIIIGICQGICYLHRDSRLRVIHRDLKASNILLDHELKPKIADFGMARIFGGDELQAKTSRVVGTYGYMSPEYAMKGVFSEKSDVYSFGVLLLELVSGKRNNSIYNDEQHWSLLRYAWKLWSEGKPEELIDSLISGPIFQDEIVKCIHVGLLCVQELAKDRPTMTYIISILNSETPYLATPKQPMLIGSKNPSHSQLSHKNHRACSTSSFSFTSVEGR